MLHEPIARITWIHLRRPQYFKSLARFFLQSTIESADYLAAHLAYFLQSILVDTGRHTSLFQDFLPLDRLQSGSAIYKMPLQTVLATLLKFVNDVFRKPWKNIRIPDGQRIQHTVHALGDQRILIQFDLIRCKLADFTRKGPQCLLEELVYGTYGKRAVIMQYIAKDRLSLGGKFSFRLTHRLGEVLQIRRLARFDSKDIQFLQDT